MGRQLKKEEWYEIFKWYKQYLNYDISRNELIVKYISFTNKRNERKSIFRLIKNKFKKYNLGMSIESQTGKSPKKGKNVGRPKKNDNRRKLQEEVLDELSKEDIKRLILDVYYDAILDKYKSKDLKEVIKKIKKTISSNISNLKIMKILGIRKSTFYYRLKKPIKNEEVKYRKEIEQSFYECKGRYGRERLSFFLKKKYNILINPRTLDRYMSTLGLYCSIRRAKRKREKKNTNVKFNNIIQRDYDGKQNDVFATDVSYIPSPKDVAENHVYLSVLIHHKTKKIVSWNLSKNNDNFSVMKHITQTKFPKKFIIHLDHGSQYSSCEYVEFIQKNNGIISMSRIGNSLDNREIEYFFSILKTKIFPEFYQKVKTFTFNELNEIIKKFIDWYNNERFMKKFDLKTPHELWEIYKNKSNWV
ncbi:IS3 family transposase [Metamycoplasma hyosynoviae]|uniref:Integrase catalytic domain-containing protein n=1 Tax=Metamycoplasma hyosynoviae TaxID=29559 RepID=A0A4P1QGE5_9BACT|nr:IS3 family transposase [Metamycoplasma hyosynoviae]ASI54028.1 hypothetical protein MHSN_02465 [Metamycoplasma hyosynoviae]MDD1374250.1 IS3 family transposase [Metamycoplasma hyosynoviae]MDD7896189.1 IS3 family transposase [Metamycoplasma hyosynoviae]MDD7897740.1 IS3 family transposase [Metamycoplasma hyosynoviae]